MYINIISDVHIYGTDPTYNSVADMEKESFDYLLGDIIDLANCHPNNLGQAVNDQIRLIEKYRAAYISGNHDLLTNNINYKIGSILLTHGDFPLWGKNNAMEFRTQKAGDGNFGRSWKKVVSKLRMIWPARLSNSDKENLYNYAVGMGANIIIIAHMHPKEVIDVTYKNIRMVVCKRGLNRIEINGV